MGRFPSMKTQPDPVMPVDCFWKEVRKPIQKGDFCVAKWGALGKRRF